MGSFQEDKLGGLLLSAHSCVGSLQEDKLGGLTHRVCHSVGVSGNQLGCSLLCGFLSGRQTPVFVTPLGVSGDQLGCLLLSAHSCVGSLQEDKLGGLTLVGLLLRAHSCVGSFQGDNLHRVCHSVGVSEDKLGGLTLAGLLLRCLLLCGSL